MRPGYNVLKVCMKRNSRRPNLPRSSVGPVGSPGKYVKIWSGQGKSVQDSTFRVVKGPVGPGVGLGVLTTGMRPKEGKQWIWASRNRHPIKDRKLWGPGRHEGHPYEKGSRS